MQLIFIDRPYTEKINMDLSIHDYNNDDDIKSPLHKMSVTTTNNNHFSTSETYIRQNKNKSSTVVVKILIGLLLVLLAVVIVFVILYVNAIKTDCNRKKETVCRTGECVQIAARKF